MKMNGLVSIKIGWIAAAYALIDIICIGLGMGVPFFASFAAAHDAVWISCDDALAPVTPRKDGMSSPG